MSDARTEYWRDAFLDAVEGTGKFQLFTSNWTDEEIAEIASSLSISAECMGLAFPTPPSPYPNEIKRLEKELVAERSKVTCAECKGSGSITTDGPYHSATSHCFKCRGEGKVAP